jgi:hypothetical protein
VPSPTAIVHAAAGSPEMPGCVECEGRCWLCGGDVARGALVSRWVSDTFTDHARVAIPTSPVVCEGCVFVCSRSSPVPGRAAGPCSVCRGTLKVVMVPKAGKGSRSAKGDDCPKCDGTGMNASGGNWRNYCAMWDERGLVTATKGEKRLVRDFLARRHESPWFCTVADSGQIHTIPFARMNGPGLGGVVLFDTELVVAPQDQSMIAAASELMTDGVTQEEIERGDYSPRSRTWSREAIDAFEATHGWERGRGWFSLGLWLAQRDKEEFERRLAARKANADRKPKKAARNSGRGDGARDPERLPARGERAPGDGLLGAAPEPHEGSGANDADGERVGDARVPPDAHPVDGQARLPGIA